jgi:hypothetical protein
MILATVLHNSEKKQITINQKHVCSFEEIYDSGIRYTEVRMSNGDVWRVIDPPFGDWLPDSFVTDKEY